MNKHLSKVKEEAEAIRRQRGGQVRKSLSGAALCVLLFFAGALFTARAQGGELPGAVPAPELLEMVWEEPPAQEGGVDAWNLLLVSEASPLPKTFTVDLEKVPGGKVDTRIANQLREMIAAAEQDGVTLTVASAYRSVRLQNSLYDKKVRVYRNRGVGEEESLRHAGRTVQPPGSSEHHTGLAIDLLTKHVTTLDKDFAKTDAYAWLQAHGADYGFAERYPKGKEEITGIEWEPWHFRYIGAEHAQVLRDSGLCLEEYIEQLQGTTPLS